jgi:hypothetical protein
MKGQVSAATEVHKDPERNEFVQGSNASPPR